MTSAPAHATAERRRSVLVVDPYEATLDLFATILDGIGCRAITVVNGSEAKTHLLASPPDLLVTELFVPDVDGYELCRTAKQATRPMPVLVVTGCVLPRQIHDAREAGADVVLEKPVSIDAFVQAVKKLLGLCSERDIARR